MTKIFGKILILMLVFVYIYSIRLKMLPTSFPMLLGFIGVGVLALEWVTNHRNKIYINSSIKSILLSMLAVICTTVLSLTFNSTTDFYFIKLIITNVLAFVGAYMMFLFIKKVYGKVEFDIWVKYITMAAFVQMILTLWLFFTPHSLDFVKNTLAINELESEVMDKLEGFRLMGFGVTFFDSGIIHSFVLILIAIVMNYRKHSFWGVFGYTLSFILIGAVGMMMARTTVVGLALALAYAFYKAKFWNLFISKKVRDIAKTIFIVAFIIIIIILNLPPDILDLLEMTSNFGFEMFIKLFDSGKLETNSTDIMYDMFVYPDSWKTWLFGDGFFAEPLDPEYLFYKGTDIGFIRTLFYVGFIGLVAFYIYQLVIVYQVYRRNMSVGIIAFALIYGLFIALNLKGFTNLFPLLILLYFCSESNFKTLDDKK